jgi:hypothetical protein
MPPKRTHAARVSRIPQEPHERQTVHSGLGMLHNWREGSAATTITMAALLPFAIAWHELSDRDRGVAYRRCDPGLGLPRGPRALPHDASDLSSVRAAARPRLEAQATPQHPPDAPRNQGASIYRSRSATRAARERPDAPAIKTRHEQGRITRGTQIGTS